MSTRAEYTEIDGQGVRIGEVHLSSDSGINPMSMATVRALRLRVASLGKPDAPHALLITSSGRCFCAGADVKEFRQFDTQAFQAYMTEVLALYADMLEAGRPIVSLVQADALGAGAALALCSDFVIAADHVRFGFPESRRGLAGGGYLIPRLVGKHLAAEMVILGRDFSAPDMLRFGLLNQVCPVGELRQHADALCAELATLAPSAFVVAKRSLSGGLTVGMAQAMARHVEAQTVAFTNARAQGLI